MSSARDLAFRLAGLLARERSALADFLVALAAFDGERRWLELGHASLFYFLHRELGLSKGAAFYRKTAAELIRRFPQVVEPLRDGRLCLTSVVELSKAITNENADEVLKRFFHLSRREAKEVSAELCPALDPPRRDVVTAVARVEQTLAMPGCPAEPRDAAMADAVHLVNRLLDIKPEPASVTPPRALAAPLRPAERRDAVEPMTADSSRLHVTVSRRFLEKLETARAALSHSHPGADAQEILEAGLDLLLQRHAKRKGHAERPRREPPPSKPEHVPAHVKRAVWERDGGRCQWKLDGGGTCGSTHRIELDHVVARGRGGASTVENVRLLCRVHNDLAARLVYGDACMDRYTRGRPRGDASAPA
jgi:5-methylcytosine-specific restriction endonuclease McrA